MGGETFDGMKGPLMRHDGSCSDPTCPICAIARFPVANPQYVRHYSCQGARMRVIAGVESNLTWTVFHDGTQMQVPTSEYKLCDPPLPEPVWTDVTSECEIRDGRLIHCPPCADTIPIFAVVTSLGYAAVLIRDGYRLRMVELCKHGDYATAFIVERSA